MKTSILLVDDEPQIARLVAEALRAQGMAFRHVESADEAYAALQESLPDVLLLDVSLRGISGLKLLEMLKKEPRTAQLPVILLTSMNGEAQKVQGLKLGADDYVLKPFSPRELAARIEALMRRVKNSGRIDAIAEVGDLRVDFERREASARGRRVDLTPAEFELLSALLRARGRTLTYDVLRDALPKGSPLATSGSVYAHVKNLRKKLGSCSDMIETVHGAGYKLAD
ncbi:MAG TPA: response regulator transcription factor [Elusimicrobiota bacterium]|jgi:DNA-binding response OmpR family regulator|nr:response regulator transcription factor [Elusimicrobiota bacterium]